MNGRSEIEVEWLLPTTSRIRIEVPELEKPLEEPEPQDSDRGGFYGICVVCRSRTPLARMVAMPATSLCLDCASQEKQSPDRALAIVPPPLGRERRSANRPLMRAPGEPIDRQITVSRSARRTG